ncbi:MAG: hypothetical protein ABH865_09310 [Candidatus Omnitrophota bacterium]|nr:hypothetical protein [Candidatus Omnitrophota bacterium]
MNAAAAAVTASESAQLVMRKSMDLPFSWLQYTPQDLYILEISKHTFFQNLLGRMHPQFLVLVQKPHRKVDCVVKKLPRLRPNIYL